MLAEGMTLALATDLCPGCWLESMQLVMQLACRLYAFSPEEALLAATVNAAQALGLADRGTLAPGKLADHSGVGSAVVRGRDLPPGQQCGDDGDQARQGLFYVE